VSPARIEYLQEWRAILNLFWVRQRWKGVRKMKMDRRAFSPAEAVRIQRNYFLSGATRSLPQRKVALKQLSTALKKHESKMIEAARQDMGRPDVETFLMEINPTLEEIDLTLKNLDRWAKPEKVHTPLLLFKATSSIYPDPYGVSVIVSAWNGQFYQLFAPLVGAIAAGNTAILKPSPDSPLCAAVAKEIVDEFFEPEHVLALVGPNEITNELLSERIDKVFFTGSPRIGKHVMTLAATNLVPMTLELGGKSPTIVDEDADVKIAARRTIWGKLFNTGQICTAPDHVYVHQRIKDRFVEQCIRSIEEFYGADARQSPDYGFIVNARNYERIVGYLKEGRILFGGRTDASRRYVEPTIIDQLSDSALLLQDEIFGPILPLVEFESLDSVLSAIGFREKPLALYYFSKSAERQDKVIRASSSGGITINDTMVHGGSPYLPFGGVGSSGMGAYHGKYTFDSFTHHKSVMHRSDWIDVALRYPPFAGKLKKIKTLTKFM
jgi:acyl-CoA reductase-like NAD-dependent aldehyde dehydrogenase